MRPPIHSSVLILLVAALVSLTSPSVASAGSFDIPACDAANGANNSWAGFATNTSVAAYALCPSGGNPGRGIIARTALIDAGNSQGVAARMQFNAPPATAITGIRASYDFYRGDTGWEAALSTGSEVLRGCPDQAATPCWATAADEWIPVPNAGAIYIDVYCATAAGCQQSTDPNSGARARLYSAIVHIQDDQPPTIGSVSGSAWTASWQGGTQNISFDAADNTGIQRNEVLLDEQIVSSNLHAACDYTFPAPCPNGGGTLDVPTRGATDGPHTLTVRSTDAAGNPSEISRTIQVDNTAPGAPQGLTVDGGNGWRPENAFAVHWTNPSGDKTSPIAGANWQLCPSGKTTDCTTGSLSGGGLTAIPSLKVPGVGDWTLTLWLRDEAGNQDVRTAAPPVHLRFDGDAPASAAFAGADPQDPTRLMVLASDATSGIAAGSIEIKKHTATAWTPLPTQATDGGVVATLPDESLRNGAYDLRATVTDAAGNARATDVRSDGTAATVTLPVRSPTHLTGGRSRPHSKKLRTRIDVRYGRRVTLHGRLTDQQHHAMGNVPLTVMARTALAGAPWRTVKTIHTTRTGRFTYRAPAGTSRVVRVRYPGTPTIRGATRDVTLRVAGASSMNVSRKHVRNGQRVRFTGRVLGHHIQAGKLVQMQARIGGRWQTFATTRTRAHGRWSSGYRFTGSTHGRYRYAFRVSIPKERGYPYRAGRSRPVHVLVTGT